jgi:hypothetical protein
VYARRGNLTNDVSPRGTTIGFRLREMYLVHRNCLAGYALNGWLPRMFSSQASMQVVNQAGRPTDGEPDANPASFLPHISDRAIFLLLMFFDIDRLEEVSGSRWHRPPNRSHRIQARRNTGMHLNPRNSKFCTIPEMQTWSWWLPNTVPSCERSR